MPGAASAGTTGAIVSAGIVAAGAVAWAVSMHDGSGARAAVAGKAGVWSGAATPIDTVRLSPGAEPVALEQGRIYYVQLCMPCHGARGDGRGEWAYRVTPRPANLSAARTRARSDTQLFEIISEPQPGTPMIGWKKQLSESQRRQLVTYVRHLSQGGVSGARH